MSKQTRLDPDRFAETVVAIVAAATGPLLARIKALESRDAPPGRDGQPGLPGRDGKDVDMVLVKGLIDDAVLKAVASLTLPVGPMGPQGEPGARGEQGPAGDKGADGAPGRDGIDGLDGKDGAPGRDGVDGKDGRDGIDGKDGAAGRDGMDGLHGKDGLPGAPGADGKDGAPGRDGLDGKDGAPGLQGERGERGEKGLDGKDGIGYPLEQLFDEGEFDPETRVATWRLRDSDKALRLKLAGIPVYRGVYDPTRTYEAGDETTREGSQWVAKCATMRCPGTLEGKDDWVLACKRGREGRPGKNGKDGLNGKDGKDGRSLTPFDPRG